MTSVHHAFDLGPSFSPWVGFAIMCGYALAALIIGGILLVPTRRLSALGRTGGPGLGIRPRGAEMP